MDQESLDEVHRVLAALPAQFKDPGFQPLAEVSRMLRSPDRQAELKELEGHLAALDKVVKKIVHAYFDGFTQSNKSYSQIIHHVSEAQERVSGLLADMAQVQKNLQDHSHEVSMLIKQKQETEQMIRLLEKLSYLRTVPLKYQQLVAKKDYLEAAMLVSTAMSQLVREDVLAVGTALVELIQAIVDAKFNFFELLLDELRQVIYGDQHSFDMMLDDAPSASDSILDSDGLEPLQERGGEESAQPVPASRLYVRTLLQSLAIMGQLNDASLFLLEQVRPALKVVIDKEMADIVQSRRKTLTSSRKKDQSPLSELLDNVLGRFQHVVCAHCVIAAELQSSINNNAKDPSSNTSGYSANAVWSCVQQVTMELLGVHLRSSILPGEAATPANVGAPAFRRRLFSFAASSAALEYVEQDDASFFQAQPSNIVVIYPQVIRFHKDALHMLLKSQGNERPDASAFQLREYLDAFVRSSFLPYVAEYHRHRATSSIDGSDAFKIRERGPPTPYKESSRPLVLAAMAAEQSITELVAAIAAIPTCAIDFMQIAEKTISRLLTRATSKSAEVMQGTEAAKFLKAEANAARMTADPAWRSLKRRPLAIGGGAVSRYESADLGEYEEEEIQTSVWSSWFNLTSLSPPDTLRIQHLSATIDSLEWLADRIDAEFAENQEHIRFEQLRHLHRGVSSGLVLAASSFSLEPLTQKLRLLCDHLLLTLRLEIGSMCFYYLNAAKHHNYAPDEAQTEPDPSVTDLCTNIRQCYEILSQNLPSAKRRYLLEPLPRLCCSLLIHILGDIPRINSLGVTQMNRNVFALQQAMASIGSAREEHFERVRRYYELLNASEEDILASISSTIARTELFSLKEYRRVLELCGGGSGRRLAEKTLQRLQELLR